MDVDESDDAYYLPAGLIGEEPEPEKPKHRLSTFVNEPEHSMPPGINTFNHSHSAWVDPLISFNEHTFSRTYEEPPSPWAAWQSQSSKYDNDTYQGYNMGAKNRIPQDPHGVGSDRARDAYNAHFFGSMNYASSPMRDDYARQPPMLAHIPAASSIHNYSSGPRSYGPSYGMNEPPNYTNESHASFSQFSQSPIQRELKRDQEDLSNSWKKRNYREKPLQPFFTTSNRPPASPPIAKKSTTVGKTRKEGRNDRKMKSSTQWVVKRKLPGVANSENTPIREPNANSLALPPASSPHAKQKISESTETSSETEELIETAEETTEDTAEDTTEETAEEIVEDTLGEVPSVPLDGFSHEVVEKREYVEEDDIVLSADAEETSKILEECDSGMENDKEIFTKENSSTSMGEASVSHILVDPIEFKSLAQPELDLSEEREMEQSKRDLSGQELRNVVLEKELPLNSPEDLPLHPTKPKEERPCLTPTIGNERAKALKDQNVTRKLWNGVVFIFMLLLQPLFTVHHTALGMLRRNHVAFTVSYIYAFPFIVSALTDDTTSAPSIIWYTFLIWFFVNRGQSTTGTPPSLNIRLLLPLLFVFEGVCNPKFIVMWNGGERLVLAFVLLSMKSNNFLHWSCFISLALLIVTSVIMGASILVQWAILIIAMSSLSPSFSMDPLSNETTNDSSAEPPSFSEDSESDYCSPSFEANLLPSATTVGFFEKTSTKSNISTRKRNKRRR